MRAVTSFDGVFLARDPVDMRKSLDGLSALVRHGMGREVDGRFLFVFVGRNRDRLKILYFDRTGYALWYKRLERARFPWPKGGEEVLELSSDVFASLLQGIDVFVKPHESVELPREW